jgi:hypothetical protein
MSLIDFLTIFLMFFSLVFLDFLDEVFLTDFLTSFLDFLEVFLTDFLTSFLDFFYSFYFIESKIKMKKRFIILYIIQKV